MGNIPSGESNNQSKTELKEEKIVKKININDQEIFNKIINISNELLLEYNSNFLKDDFCNKLAIIYQKKMSQFNIKLLKSLYADITSPDIDNELLMTLQYLPENDDSFFVDIFNQQLLENFWSKDVNIDYKLLKGDSKLSIESMAELLKNKIRYIIPRHVNSLLTNTNSDKNIIVGGNKKIVKSSKKIKKSLDIKKLGINIKEILKLNKLSGGHYGNTNTKTKMNIKKENENNLNSENIIKKFIRNKNKEKEKENESIKNTNINNGIIRSSQEKAIQGYSVNTNKNINSNNKSNTNKNTNKNKNTNININTNTNTNTTLNKNTDITTNADKNTNITTNSNKNNNITTNITSNSNENENKNKDVNKEKNNSLRNLNKRTNELIIKNSNIEEEDIITNMPEEKIANTILKYSVPKYYKIPKKFCSETKKCQLTKNELCQAISENLIVRNNIIAAILTAIPYKNENGEYIGGICYQKFLNLELCRVCLPPEFESLKNKDITYILKKILEKSDALDEEKCSANKGVFRTLDEQEKIIFGKKLFVTDKIELAKNPDIKYNHLYVELTQKLKERYFNDLNNLISILEKIKDSVIINNVTLNAISKETKNIIDNMYSLSHYYYVYAIIAFIKADLSDDKVQVDPLENVFDDVLQRGLF